jgi:diguanylate cyclase (GGDEF)-like protein
MIKVFFNNISKNSLTEEQRNSILHHIEMENLIRMKLILVGFAVIEILFILFNDIPYLINSSTKIIWNDTRFFLVHLLLLIICAIGLIIVSKLIKADSGELRRIYNYFAPILIVVILILVSIINGLDQIKIGSVSSVFIATILIFSGTIVIEFPKNILVYTIPLFSYIGTLKVLQPDADKLIFSNTINGLIFFVIVIMISTVIYNNNYEKLAKTIILEEANFKLNYMSSHDALTGLLNRRSFRQKVNEKMQDIINNKEDAVLVVIDIDYFKEVNDKFGHPIGDLVLKEVSNILMEHIKTTDLATRWGGEEFVLFLYKTSIDEAYALADKIRLAIKEKTILLDNFNIQITASFGVALIKDNTITSFETAYKAADKALYQAKNQGRNQVVVDSLTTEE